jgi:hypothetical protein
MKGEQEQARFGLLSYAVLFLEASNNNNNSKLVLLPWPHHSELESQVLVPVVL